MGRTNTRVVGTLHDARELIASAAEQLIVSRMILDTNTDGIVNEQDVFDLYDVVYDLGQSDPDLKRLVQVFGDLDGDARLTPSDISAWLDLWYAGPSN